MRSLIPRAALALIAQVAALLFGAPALADRVATLTLDGFSVLSLDDKRIYAIPAGGAIAMHFADAPKGRVAAFRIETADFDIGPVSTGPGQGIILRLIKPAIGAASFDPRGRCVFVFTADVSVSLVHPTQAGSKRLRLRFTTEGVEAKSADGRTRLALTGVRANLTERALQLVAATTNDRHDPLGPGAAVYAVLSGTLDRLP